MTAYSPRSGIVPAFAIASWRDPLRARIVPGDAVPHDAGAQLPELLGRIAPVEHVEHVLQQLARELGVGVRAGDERVQLVHRDLLGRDGDRDYLLGQHVERVAGDDGRLDLTFVHPAHDDRALEQIAAELGEDPPAADLADAVTCAADALEAARDGLGRLDLQDEVDRPHVDAELQRAGGNQARELASLEELLDLRALLAGERAVVGARDLA